MNKYVFLLKNGAVILVSAQTLGAAMVKVESEWYRGELSRGFEVHIVTGESH